MSTERAGPRGPTVRPLTLLSALETVPPAVARAHRVVPLRLEGRRLVVGAVRPHTRRLRAALARLGHGDAVIEPWADVDMRTVLDTRYGASADLFELSRQLSARPVEADAPTLTATAQPDEVPAVRFVNAMLGAAVIEGATDVHLDSGGPEPRLRFRRDGVLVERPAPPEWLVPRVVGRVKALAGLDLGESLNALDGTFAWEGAGRTVDIRVSVLPAERGPAVVLRLLTKEDDLPDLRGLGMPLPLRRMVHRAATAPDGLVVVAGPTGAGKTTTLHALLALETGERNVVSIEDPVEIRRRSVRQVAVRRRSGLNFAGALRSILRQDPDVILVGETRDQETATLVVQAAVAGHLVLTTVHASSVFGVFDRFLQLGADRALLADSARLVLSQRLVRKVCRPCRGRGCLRCEGSGLQGRIGVFEALPLTRALRGRVLQSGPERERLARAAGYRSLTDEASRLLKLGLTTRRELRRVLGDEMPKAAP